MDSSHQTEIEEAREEDVPAQEDLNAPPAEASATRERSRRQEPSADEEGVVEIALTPGCVVGGLVVVALLAVLAGAGVWAAGEFAGVGPFATTASTAPGAPASGVSRSASGAAQAPGQVPNTTVVTVNGEPITTQELDNLVAINLAMTRLQSGETVNLTPQQRQQARTELLNQAVRNTLILQAARSAGLTVSEEQAEAEWLAWVRRSGLTPDQLDAQLQQAGTDREAFKEWLGSALIANQYLMQYVAQGAAPEERTQVYEQWMQQQLQNAQIQYYQTPAPPANQTPSN